METQLDLLQHTLETWAGRAMPSDLRKKLASIAQKEFWKKGDCCFFFSERWNLHG